MLPSEHVHLIFVPIRIGTPHVPPAAPLLPLLPASPLELLRQLTLVVWLQLAASRHESCASVALEQSCAHWDGSVLHVVARDWHLEEQFAAGCPLDPLVPLLDPLVVPVDDEAHAEKSASAASAPPANQPKLRIGEEHHPKRGMSTRGHRQPRSARKVLSREDEERLLRGRARGAARARPAP